METDVKFGIYTDPRGLYYQVMSVGSDTENNNSPVVVYKGLFYDEKLGHNPVFVRSKAKFLENIVVDGKTVPAFRFVEFKKN